MLIYEKKALTQNSSIFLQTHRILTEFSYGITQNLSNDINYNYLYSVIIFFNILCLLQCSSLKIITLFHSPRYHRVYKPPARNMYTVSTQYVTNTPTPKEEEKTHIGIHFIKLQVPFLKKYFTFFYWNLIIIMLPQQN